MSLTKIIVALVLLISGTNQPSVLATLPLKIQRAPIEMEITADLLIPEKITFKALPDLHPYCPKMANRGKCHSHPKRMLEDCISSCLAGGDLGTIGYFYEFVEEDNEKTAECINSHDFNPDSFSTCEELAELGECHLNPDYMLEYCAKSCLVCLPVGTETYTIGVAQEIPEEFQNDPEHTKKTLQVITSTSAYMTTKVMEEAAYDWIRRSCRNIYAHCASNAASGYCEDDEENDIYYEMITGCAPACELCDTFEVVETCTVNEQSNIFEEGDMDMMFRRIVGETPPMEGMILPDYVPVVHSRPDQPPVSTTQDSDYILGPWVITLDNFLSYEECDHLIKLGKLAGYDKSELSEDEDEEDEEEKEEEEEEEEEEEYRTSVNSWCTGECNSDPVVRDVVERISNITGIPESYSEHLQMLKYTAGQYYKTHHDFIDGSDQEIPGQRLITVFLYLNDVEEGGATRFNDLSSNDENLSLDIHSKKGTALIWPSVENDPSVLEERTYHEALPVIKGVKYGANAWLHQRKYKNDNCDYDMFSEVSWHPSFA